MPLLIAVVVSFWLIHTWYFRQVCQARAQVHHPNGHCVPGRDPRLLVGNLPEVYRADNRLSAYHRFHDTFGEIVQIFWMWRQQISVTSYPMARHVLVANQKNYHKFPPNTLLQRLYGSSVLTSDGDNWKRQRRLLNEVFARHRVATFHDSFVACTEKLVEKWTRQVTPDGAPCNVYPDLMLLFLDMIGQTMMGQDFGALAGAADEFLESLHYIVAQSTHPLHQFVRWWQKIPLPANQKLAKAFDTVDHFLDALIAQRKAVLAEGVLTQSSKSPDVLDLLLQAANLVTESVPPLSDTEVRDNLLAILVNGHETVATSVAFTLNFLARHPEALQQAQAETDRVMSEQGRLPVGAPMPYLDRVVTESLRLCPPMAGIQRISLGADTLTGWSIPTEQPVGITLMPLHQNADYYGAEPAAFRPERYDQAGSGCPVATQPLSFGDGARKCLGEHFARYEMRIAIAILIHRFNFEAVPGFEAEPELGKFGLFISMYPKNGVSLVVSCRNPILSEKPHSGETP
ncbi:MAG: cytochrome P450 [Cyanobacteria bacterium P01_A01_bin.137]